MKKKKKKQSSKWKIKKRSRVGSLPGHIKSSKNELDTIISVISYNESECREEEASLKTIERLAKSSDKKIWINVTGLQAKETIAELAKALNIHPLALSDVFTDFQRPKIESYPDQLFFTSRLFHWFENSLIFEQISFFVSKNYVLTFQHYEEDPFDPIRQRLFKGQGQMRSKGSDYFAYSLLDLIVDSYFPILEQFGDTLDYLEEQILNAPKTEHISQLHDIKSDLVKFRRSIWTQRDSLQQLTRESSDLIEDHTYFYLRDTLDHTTQVIDLLENFREMSSSLLEVHLSTTSNKLNEVMKVLTVISTIFMPLSFLAGLYGMNFNPQASKWNMPELNWIYGYPTVLILMGIMVSCMLYYFRKKKWF